MKAVYATGTNYDDPLSMLEVGDMPKTRNQAILVHHSCEISEREPS